MTRCFLASLLGALALTAGAQATQPAQRAPKTPEMRVEPPKGTPPTNQSPGPADGKPAPGQPTDPNAPAPGDKTVLVRMTTTMGDIVLELNETKAPITVKNFLGYVDNHFYEGTVFHRVIKDFMIQGGGHTEDLREKVPGPKIKNEWRNGLKNSRGTIAMARAYGGDTASAQFFINVKANTLLDKEQQDGAGYAVFGRVVQGMDVVDKIQSVKTGVRKEMGDVPLDTVTIRVVRREPPADANPPPASAPPPAAPGK